MKTTLLLYAAACLLAGCSGPKGATGSGAPDAQAAGDAQSDGALDTGVGDSDVPRPDGAVDTGAVDAAPETSPPHDAGVPKPTDNLELIPENTWTLVNDGGLQTSVGILSYSGMALDTLHNQLIVFGGDTWATAGTTPGRSTSGRSSGTRCTRATRARMICLRRHSTTRTTPARSSTRWASPSPTRCLPACRHTYDTLEFIESAGVVIMGGRFGWRNGQSGLAWCTSCYDTWTYDFGANHWTYRNVSRGPRPSGTGGWAYDPISDRVYAVDQTATWSYSLASDSWTQLKTTGAPTSSIERSATYDSHRQALFVLGGKYPSNNELWRFDIKSRSWTKMNPNGETLAKDGGWGLAARSLWVATTGRSTPGPTATGPEALGVTVRVAGVV